MRAKIGPHPERRKGTISGVAFCTQVTGCNGSMWVLLMKAGRRKLRMVGCKLFGRKDFAALFGESGV